ncbi:MAG TPA: zf-HC2 domain-containing protein, partial [Ktedonobacterales bacterium]|nr:zf-HC2 domain-containing protein [Ktedonobacterales bacterium]
MSGSPSATAHVEPLLAAHHAGALSPADAAQVERHLRGCAACRKRSEQIAIDQIIRAAPAPTVGPELRQRLYARIAAVNSEASETDARASLRDARRVESRPLIRSHGPRVAQRGWLSGVAAVLLVALLVGVFWTLPHIRRQAAPAATATVAISPPIVGPVACAPGATSINLPANTVLSDMALTSPTDGWAVGGTMSDQGYMTQGVIMRFSKCKWSPVAFDLKGMGLSQIAMDSPTDGWATGDSTDSNDPVLFHLSDGVWKQAPLPDELQVANSYIAQMRAFAPGNVWLTAFTPKTSQGQMSPMLLLHLMNGQWSTVICPLPILYAVAPVGPEELWLAGETATTTDQASHFRFAHFKDGQWSVMLQPEGAELTTLRATSPTDVWASGYIPAAQSAGFFVRPVVAHYDGSGWQAAPQAIPPNAGADVMTYALGDGEGWAELVTTHESAQGPPRAAISTLWRETG